MKEKSQHNYVLNAFYMLDPKINIIYNGRLSKR